MSTISLHRQPLRETLRRAYLRRVVAPTLRIAGPRFTDRLARRAGSGLYRLAPPIREIALRRATRALSSTHTPAEIRRIVSLSFEHAARFWAETLFVQRMIGRGTWQRFVTIEGTRAAATPAVSVDAMLAAHRSGRGIIFTTAYFGNPAVAAAALGRWLGAIHVVAAFDGGGGFWANDLRGMSGVHIVPRREAVQRIPVILESGGAVFVIGEHHRPRGGVPVEWLGTSICAYPTLGLVSRATGALIAPFLCARTGAFHFSMELAACLAPCDDFAPYDMVRAALRSLECGIRQRPEQYLWAMTAP